MASLEETTTTITTGRRARNPVSYAYPDSDDDEEKSPTSSTNNNSDGDDNSISNANEDSTERVKLPTIHDWRHWRNKGSDPEQSGFQSVDGDKIFYTCRWRGGRYLDGWAEDAMRKAERSLVSKQDDQHSITQEFDDFGRSGRITQVPYHADMLPFYEYFAQGIQQHSDIQTFKIINHHLPPSPWLGDSVLPVLEMNSNGRVYEGNMTTLELSNCSLSADDMASVAKFLSGNTTLHSLDISKNDIESVDSVKALAKAIKKHPRLGHVGLAYCSLGGGDHDVLDKILVACKECVSLEIGHSDFDSEGVASIAKFLGRKNSLTSFSLMAAPVDKENKALLTKGLVKNKTLEQLCLHSNGLQLPGILRNTKKIIESLTRLTHLDLSFNTLPVQGAKIMAKFLAEADSSLVTLIMTNNRMTAKGANILLPALKENTTLQDLDLSQNWLSDAVAPVVIDVLKNNSTLLSFDLSGNKSLKGARGGHREWRTGQRTPQQDRGRAEIVKGALFDTTSLEAIGNSNHSCAVTMAGFNQKGTHEETIRKINSLDVSEGKKIRYKVLLALNEANKDLYDPRSFNDVPLELMPYLLEMVQQEFKCNGSDIVLKSMTTRKKGKWVWNPEKRRSVYDYNYITDPTLNRLYEIISGWQSLPLLFVRGAGELKSKKKTQAKKKKKSQSKPRKRKRFGEEDGDEDEPFIPKGARKTTRYVYNSETKRYTRIQEWQVGGSKVVV